MTAAAAVILYCLILLTTNLSAETVSVSATVPGVNAFFEGLTAPLNIVTLFEMSQGIQIPPEWSMTNTVLVGGVGDYPFDSAKDLGSFRANEDGLFQFLFVLKFFRDQNLCLRATDATGDVSRPICFLLGTEKFDQEFTNVILPPSFRIESTLNENQVRVSGYTLKNAKVTLFFDGKILEPPISAGQTGLFSRRVIINDHARHAIFIRAERNGLVTPVSETKYFQILPPLYTPQRWVHEIKEGLARLVKDRTNLLWLLLVAGELTTIIVLARRRRLANRSSHTPPPTILS